MDKVIKFTPYDASGQLTSQINGAAKKRFPDLELFFPGPIVGLRQNAASNSDLQGSVMRDKSKMNEMANPRPRRTEDGLGPNSDIGAKLRAYYGTVQEEPIPEKFLDLLEKLDQAEQKPASADKEE